MLEQDLRKIWKGSSKALDISIETQQLLQAFDIKMAKINRQIKLRNIREIGASIIGIILFSFLFYEIPFPITKLACSLTMGWFLLVIYKYRKTKIHAIPTMANLNIQKQLKLHQDTILKQINLMESSLYWYTIPPFIINFIFILGLGNPDDYNWSNFIADNYLPLSVRFKTSLIIGLGLFYMSNFWFSKRALKRELKPLIYQLNTLKRKL